MSLSYYIIIQYCCCFIEYINTVVVSGQLVEIRFGLISCHAVTRLWTNRIDNVCVYTQITRDAQSRRAKRIKKAQAK